jgi:hypothetical protein
MTKVTLPDGSVKEMEAGSSAMDVAMQISHAKGVVNSGPTALNSSKIPLSKKASLSLRNY